MDLASHSTSISAGKDVYGILTSSSEIAEMTETVFPVVIPVANLTPPYIVYRAIGMEGCELKRASPQETVSMQVDCVGRDYSESVRLAEAAGRAMRGFLRLSTVTKLLSICRLSGRVEFWEDGAFVQRLIFSMVY